MNEEMREALVDAILDLVENATTSDVTSVESNCGTIYVETANGETYAISVMKTEA